jgi:sRNA-binding carbon storage regulator CsrA
MCIEIVCGALQVRKELGIGDDVKLVIFNFGGQVRIFFIFLTFVDMTVLSHRKGETIMIT